MQIDSSFELATRARGGLAGAARPRADRAMSTRRDRHGVGTPRAALTE